MRSENLDGAVNQQERLSSEECRAWFLAGLVEGEGSVCVGIHRNAARPFGYYVQPELRIYQHRSRRELLELAHEYFGAGRIRPKPGNRDVLVYSIISRAVIVERVLPFFADYMQYSARTTDYEKFAAVVRMLEAGVHHVPAGLALIVEIAYSMNMAGKQRRTPREVILDRILRGHMPDAPSQGEDMVRPPWRHGELGGTRNDPATQQQLRSNTSA